MLITIGANQRLPILIDHFMIENIFKYNLYCYTSSSIAFFFIFLTNLKFLLSTVFCNRDGHGFGARLHFSDSDSDPGLEFSGKKRIQYAWYGA